MKPKLHIVEGDAAPKRTRGSKPLGDELEDLIAKWTTEGWLEEKERERDAEREERKAREISEWLVEMERRGIPEEHRLQVSQGCHATECLKRTRDFLRSEARILVLAGTQGVGKTLAAAWAVRPRLYPVDGERGLERGGWFVDASELAQLNRYDRALWRHMGHCRILAIDDLGLEYLDEPGYALSIFDSLLKVRHANRRKTVMTTNLNWSAFRERYGPRIADRINDGAFFEAQGKSLRGRK